MGVRHLLDIDDLTKNEVLTIISLADKKQVDKVLENKGVVLIFEKPSLRTRSSMELAAHVLGAHVITLRQDEIGINSRESLYDITRTLISMYPILGARVFSHESLIEMKQTVDSTDKFSSIVNLLSDTSHPCQILADLVTLNEAIPEKGYQTFEELTLSYVGDPNNVCNSLMKASAIMGFNMKVACPPNYTPSQSVLDSVRAMGREIYITSDPKDAVADADVIYTDTWVSMGNEDQKQQRYEAFRNYQVNEELLSVAKKDASVMHCMPAHRGDEITDEVINGPNSIVYKQAENRYHSARALLWWLATVGDAGKGHWPSVLGGSWRSDW
jgi:ornithine carbamoyltransferase